MDFLPETVEAERLIRTGQIRAARALLAQAVTRHPRDAEAWRLLADILDDPAQKRYALGRAQQLDRTEPSSLPPAPPAPTRDDPRTWEPTARPMVPPAAAPTPARPSLWDPLPVDHDAASSLPAAPEPVRRLTPLEMIQKRDEEEAAAARRSNEQTRSARLGWVIGGLAAVCLMGVAAFAGVWFWLRPHAAPAPVAQMPAASATPAATAAPTVTPQPYAVAFVEGRCPFQPPANAAVTCGTVNVPEDRAKPDGPSVTLAVAVYHSARSNVETPPLFFLQGGPGADAIAWSALVHASVVAPIVAERDFVVFDQRGTGFSSPKLECPDLHTDDPVAAASACHDSLTAAGINLAAYTTAASAADVRDIARALHYGRVDLYGISYGTRLAMTIMRDDPTLVRAAVLDSALPPEVLRINETAANAEQALDSLFADCAADPVCAATYPDLAETFDALLAQAAAQPIVIPGADALGGAQSLQLDPAGVINAAVWGLHISDYIPALPYAITALQQGDVTSLNPVAAIFASAAPDMSSVVNLAITCHEQILPTSAEALNASFDAHPRTAAFGRLHVFGDAATGIAVCQALGLSAATEAELQPLKTELPSLILAGALDPTTPADYGRQAAHESSRSAFVLWQEAGHAVSVGPDARCAQSIISQFLTDPAARLDTTCVAATTRRAFLAPGDLAVQAAPAAMADTAPRSSDPVPSGASGSNAGDDPAPQDGGGGDDSGLASGEPFVGLMGVSIDQCLVCLSHFLGLEPGQLYYETGVETGGQVWFLYRADNYFGRIVDIAVAAVPDGTLFVLMLTDPGNRDAYYGSVYLPTIDAATTAYWGDLEPSEPVT